MGTREEGAEWTMGGCACVEGGGRHNAVGKGGATSRGPCGAWLELYVGCVLTGPLEGEATANDCRNAMGLVWRVACRSLAALAHKPPRTALLQEQGATRKMHPRPKHTYACPLKKKVHDSDEYRMRDLAPCHTQTATLTR